MLNTLFQGVFTSTTTIQIPQFLLCIAISLAIGLFLSFLLYAQKPLHEKFCCNACTAPGCRMCCHHDG